MGTLPDGQVPSILLWGARSKARISAQMIAESLLGEVRLIFDHTLDQPQFETAASFTNDPKELSDRLSEMSHFVVCIGGEHGYARVETARHLEKLGLRPLSLKHQTSYVDDTVILGSGSQLMPSSNIHKFTEVGDQCIFNTNSTVDHECAVGNGVHIMVGAALAGLVSVGDYATVGTNATVLPRITIGEGAFVGAGSVVTHDVAPGVVVAGNPAQPLRQHVLAFDGDVLDALGSPNPS